MFPIHIRRRYLHLPVKDRAPIRKVNLLVEGRTVREFDIELAEVEPDWWAFLDLSPWMDKEAVLQVSPPPEDQRVWESIHQGDEIQEFDSLYRETLRPQFHFTNRLGWNNDPNGLVFYAGEYHLFYQHNPYGIHWGNMHWGHAISPDLVHWRELPEALYPDELGTMFSGSGVVDWRNSAGFGQGQEQPLVILYTAAGGTSALSEGRPFTQCLAYSLDRGRSWIKWVGNPVIDMITGPNRDPKVIWHASTGRWIMALYLEGSDYVLLSSPDLKNWSRTSAISIPGCIECPDLFELAVDGNSQDTRWVFWCSQTTYLIGRFDGQTFTQESLVERSHWGGSTYAAQTWSDVPDGRRIQISWLQVEIPGMRFNQGMTFPVELALHTTEEGIRLISWPVREIETLYQKKYTLEGRALLPGENPLVGVEGEHFDLQVELSPGSADQVSLALRGVRLVYDTHEETLSCLDRSAPLKIKGGKIRLRILVDRTSIEIFGSNGQVYLPLGVVLDPENRSLEIFARGGKARIETLTLFELESIWVEAK